MEFRSNKIIQNKERLEYCLSILKVSRKKVVNDFMVENPDIYSPSFQYENDEILLKFSIEKYFCIWINNHLIDAVRKSKNLLNDQSQDFFTFFCKNFYEFLNKIKISGRENCSPLYFDLLEEKIEFINKLLEKDEEVEERFKKINLISKKENRLFDREFKKLLEKDHENFVAN